MKITRRNLNRLVQKYLFEITDYGDFSLGASIQKDNVGGQSTSHDYSFQQSDDVDIGASDDDTRSVDLGDVKVLFVGDSQTYWPGVSYANRLLKSSDISGKNISKNGASLSTIKGFLRKGLASDNYDVITIMGGGNDSPQSNPNYSLYDDMYDMAKQSNALLVAITNPTKNNLSKEKRSKYPSNEKLANYVRLNNKPDITIDANQDFADKSNFNSDMVHINSDAHKELTEKWRSAVFQKLKNKFS